MFHGGNNRARTCDPLLVRQVLSQLSYAPESVLYLSDGEGYYSKEAVRLSRANSNFFYSLEKGGGPGILRPAHNRSGSGFLEQRLQILPGEMIHLVAELAGEVGAPLFLDE